MIFDEGSMQSKSNLDCFLRRTTPVVPSQFLPKVLLFAFVLLIFVFCLVHCVLCFFFVVILSFCVFLSDSTRFETLTDCGTRGREKLLSTSLWVIYGIVSTNGVLMELEFPSRCPMGRHLFSTMFLTSPQFRYSPATLSGMFYIYAHEDNLYQFCGGCCSIFCSFESNHGLRVFVDVRIVI